MSQILTTSFIHIHRQYGSYLVYLVSTISLLLHAKMPPATHREWKLNGRQSFDCLKLNKDIPTPSPKGSEVLIQGKPLRTNAYSQGGIAELPRRCDRIREIPSTRQRRLDALVRRSRRGLAVGPYATSFKVGDKVIPTCFTDWITGRIGETRSLGNKNDGVLREYMTVEERGLVHMPSNYTFAEASTLACAALTAWNALYGLKRVMPGDWVLTEGTGGVSLFAIQVSNVSSPTPLHLCPDTSLPKSQVHE
jgi:hypothetical protein